jgi:hypothetical protein
MGNPAQRFAGDRATYPGMQVAEILVWRAWLQQNGAAYDRFDYNVMLGPGITPPATLVEPYRTASINASKFRIDAVGWQGGTPTIFEVERYARARSLGQLLTYLALWEQEYQSSVSPGLVLVCAGFNPLILPAAVANDVDLAVVPVNFSSLAPARLNT